MTYPIPDPAFIEHIAFLGSTGAGKTWAAKTAVELLFGRADTKICIVDPTSAWYGLRLSRDGKYQGLPFVILGGDHGDAPLTEHNGEAVAGLIVEGRHQYVIDISTMLLSEQRRFMTAFAEHIFKLNRNPLHLVIDEADSFMPQKPMRDQTLMLNRMDRLVRRGRSRGFRIMLLSQRPAVLNKDSLSQVGTLVAMRLRSPQDRAAIEAWIEGQADKKRGKAIVDSLPGLKRGEAWVWSPGHEILERVQFPEIMTFDSSADPVGGQVVNIGQWTDGIGYIQEALDPDFGEVEPADIQKATVVRGDAEIQQARAVKSAEQDGYDRGLKDGRSAGIAEVMEIVGELRDAHTAHGDLVNNIILKMGHTEVRGRTDQANGKLVIETNPGGAQWSKDIFTRGKTGKADSTDPTFNKHRAEAATMPKAERTILTALAQHGPCDKARLAILTCYAANGGGFANALGALRTKGFIEPGEPIGLTNAGKAVAPDYEKLPVGHKLVQWWRQNPVLGKAERLILDAVTSRLRPVTKSDLAAMTGYAEAGGGFANALGRLRTLGLITGSRDIAASEHLR